LTPICDTVRKKKRRTAANRNSTGKITGTSRVRTQRAVPPRFVTKVNARSVVATSRRAKPILSSS
jgi:hypothetical protein